VVLAQRTQAAIEGRHRGQHDAVAEQLRMDLARAGVDEAFAVQGGENRLVLFGGQPACRARAGAVALRRR